MNFSDYTREALKTEKNRDSLLSFDQIYLHRGLNFFVVAGEYVDLLKKRSINGKAPQASKISELFLNGLRNLRLLNDYFSSTGSYQSSTLKTVRESRATHGLLAIATEVTELVDLVNKQGMNAFSDNPDVREELMLELGDVLWGLALFMDALEIDIDVVERMNIAKLRARYGDEFTHEKAQNRDTDKEKQAARGEANGNV